jgi:hypothetical protein
VVVAVTVSGGPVVADDAVGEDVSKPATSATAAAEPAMAPIWADQRALRRIHTVRRSGMSAPLSEPAQWDDLGFTSA